MSTPYYQDAAVTLHLGDSLNILPTLPDSSIDAVICDPPYELRFMGRKWDASGIAYSVELWSECLRVLKPGGHLAAFGGTRTYHRMTCAIEDAGFEIRDSLHWIYGSGFPKGIDVSKAIDKRREDRADILRVTALLAAARDRAGRTNRDIDQAFGFNGMAGHWTARSAQAAVPTWEQWQKLRTFIHCGDDMDAEVWRLNGRKGTPGEAWEQREVIGTRTSGIGTGRGDVAYIGDSSNRDITAPATDDAARWEGWNTSLRPSHEPIVLARRPLTGTVAGNVLEHGTGAINIGATRVGATSRPIMARTANITTASSMNGESTGSTATGETTTLGRWPANVLLSHLPLLDDDGQPTGDACADGCIDGCAVREMDQQSGVTVSRTASRGERHGVVYGNGKGPTGPDTVRGHDDTGGASRFFPVFRYQAKAPARERPRLPDGTSHPTVKPQALMAWLCRLLTPPGGTVLDPFAGSGTTLEAARAEGFRAVGIEQNPPYADLCRIRLTRPAAPATPVEPGEQHDRADDTLFTLPTAGESGRPHP